MRDAPSDSNWPLGRAPTRRHAPWLDVRALPPRRRERFEALTAAHQQRMKDLAQLSLRTISPGSVNAACLPGSGGSGDSGGGDGVRAAASSSSLYRREAMQERLHQVQQRLDECRVHNASLAAGPMHEDPAALDRL